MHRREIAWLLPCSLLLLSVACSSSRSTTGRAAAPDCSGLEGYGFAPSEPAGPMTEPPETVTSLEGLLAWYRAEPTTWKRNLGFAMALDRVAGGEEWSIGKGQTVELKPLPPLPPGISNVRLAAREAYLRAVMSGGEFVTLAAPVPGSFENELSFDTVALWACGRNFPVYVAPGREVEGVLASPDRSRLAVVHVGKRSYSGAAVPLYLGKVEITLVDVRTFATTSLPVDVGDTFSFQSIALAWASPTRLRLRLKDVWNTADNKRIYATCDVEQLPCTLPTAVTPAERDFPREGVLEVTSRAAYQLEPVPAGFQPSTDVLPRTVHVSPDGRWVSYVTDDGDANELFPSTRRLWVRPASGGDPVEVARGEGPLHARWLDAEQLVFEAPPEPSPKLARVMLGLRESTELKFQAESIAGDAEEPGTTQRVLELLVRQKALRQFASEQVPATELWELPLRRYSPRTGKIVEHHPGPARLWSHLGGPTHHHKGPAREIPAD